MQQILCVFLCLSLCGCGKTESKAVVTPSLLAKIEKRLDDRINKEALASSEGILECRADLGKRIGFVEADVKSHRGETASFVTRMEQRFRDQDARELAARNGQGGGNDLAYSPQSVVPNPPREDRPGPSVDQRSDPRYVITRASSCIAIQDTKTGWHYQWRLEQQEWRLVLWQQSYCAGHKCVHPQWVYTNPPQGFPTP